MQDTDHRDPSNPDANPEAGPRKPEQIPTRKTKPRVRRLSIYGYFAAVLFVVAGVVVSADVHLVRLWNGCLLGGLILSAFEIRLRLINHGSLHRNANAWWAVVVVPSVGLCVFLFWWDCVRHSPPHLALYLTASDSPQELLHFTNDFFHVKGRGPDASVPRRWGFVVIRVPFEGTNVVLRFGALNDSAAQYEVVDDSILTVDVAEIDLLILPGEQRGPAIGWVADPAWKQKSTPDGRGKILHFSIPSALLPGRGEPGPGITFTNTGRLTDNLAVVATLRGKRVPQTHFVFNLIFVPSNEIIPPSCLGPTNPVAAMILERRKPAGPITNAF
jgi:hypothetical protein